MDPRIKAGLEASHPISRETLHFDHIQKFTGQPNYRVSIGWKSLVASIEQYKIDIDPDFQRGHVWTKAQQSAYIEFRLRGGMTGHEIYANNPTISSVKWLPGQDVGVLVDGKQRITAVLEYLADKVPVFGGYLYSEIVDHPRLDARVNFIFCINNLQTRAEVLKWYLELNSGGVVHTPEELDRVANLLKEEELHGSR